MMKDSASEMTYTVSGGALNSTHSLPMVKDNKAYNNCGVNCGPVYIYIYISLFASKNADKQTERDSKN